MLKQLIKDIEQMIEILGEKAAEESINEMFAVASLEELNESITEEISYLSDSSNR